MQGAAELPRVGSAALLCFTLPAISPPLLVAVLERKGGPLLTSLDPDRIAVENPESRASEPDWRFRFSAGLRRILLDNVWSLGLTDQQRARFIACGSQAWVQYSPSADRYRVRSNACNLRWCPACRKAAGGHVKTWIKQLLDEKPVHGWKLITLTLKHSNEPLADQLKTLRSAFRRLRQRAFWKKAAVGGLYVFELTVNPDNGTWHPHVHVLLDSLYIPQKLLSSQWLSASRSSRIVDIRAVHRVDTAADYITKYLTKSPPRLITEQTTRMSEYIEALHGTRLVSRFGACTTYEPPPPVNQAVRDWEPVKTLAALLTEASAGNLSSRRILTLLGDKSHATLHPDVDVDSQAVLPFLPGGT